jgi:ribonuclease BN (tRNA processing enzyme)
MISNLKYNLLVDAGDSVSRAILSQNISYNSINGILISHLHPDHYSGFAALILQMKMNKRKKPLFIFVHHTLVKTLKDFLAGSYIFMERMDFPVHFKGFNFENKILITPGLTCISKKNTHLDEYQRYDPSLSYACGSFLFKSANKKVFYSGDIGSPDDLYLFKDDKIDIYITETAHVTFSNILSMSEALRPGKIVLTHLSDEDISSIKENLMNTKNDSIIMAEDGLILGV